MRISDWSSDVCSSEFILFPGDEVIGLTRDEAALRAQWRHWFEVEMAWLDRSRIPLFHTTANHTTYDPMSERVFAEVMAHLPRNGPPGPGGLKIGRASCRERGCECV